MASIFCNSLDSRLFGRVISKELSGNSSHRWHGHALRKASSANALKFFVQPSRLTVDVLDNKAYCLTLFPRHLEDKYRGCHK
jgi:hypothetical protein